MVDKVKKREKLVDSLRARNKETNPLIKNVNLTDCCGQEQLNRPAVVDKVKKRVKLVDSNQR